MTNTRFKRTTKGKIVQYRFYTKPLVWLEGDTDYQFLEPLTREMDCVLQSAGGVEECRKLAQAMMNDNLPYVVVMDGDYEILHRQRSRHRRAILLQRHSIENYCAEMMVVQVVCGRYSQGKVGERQAVTRFARLVAQLEGELKALVALDIASNYLEARTRQKGVLPKSILAVLRQRTPPKFDHKRIRKILRENGQGVDDDTKEEAKRLLDAFIGRKRFVDILKGHWVFELIRWFIVAELGKVGMRVRIDDEALRMLLGSELWREGRSDDHRRLRRGLRRAIREVRRMRQPNGGRS